MTNTETQKQVGYEMALEGLPMPDEILDGELTTGYDWNKPIKYMYEQGFDDGAAWGHSCGHCLGAAAIMLAALKRVKRDMTCELGNTGWQSNFSYVDDAIDNAELRRVQDMGTLTIGDVARTLTKIMRIMHYPECWDTVAYPHLTDAVREAFTCQHCYDKLMKAKKEKHP